MTRERRIDPPAGRSTIGLPKETLLQELQQRTQPATTDSDPDRIVDKTYKLRAGVVAAIKEIAVQHNVGIGELVEWLLTEGIDDLTQGRKHLPLHAVQVEVPVLGARRRGRPGMRRLAKGTVRYSGSEDADDHRSDEGAAGALHRDGVHDR